MISLQIDLDDCLSAKGTMTDPVAAIGPYAALFVWLHPMIFGGNPLGM
jgi:hypothetical protein